MTVEELHGVFQFTDDLFDDENKKERNLVVDRNYTPRKIYPRWYADGIEQTSEDSEQSSVRLMIPDLYRRGEYEQVLKLCNICIQQLYSSHKGGNIAGAIRDLTETQVCSLMKLGRPFEALPLLHLLDGVEEPGRLIVKSKVFFETGHHAECIVECRKYLALRPGDYLIASRMAECMILLGDHGEEVRRLLAFAQQTISCYLNDAITPDFLKSKYQLDIQKIVSLQSKIL